MSDCTFQGGFIFFSQLGRIAAFLVLLLGVLRVVLGLTIANECVLPYEEVFLS